MELVGVPEPLHREALAIWLKARGAGHPDTARSYVFLAVNLNARGRHAEAEQELQAIVERLERGDAPLDETLALWQRGEELYRFCRDQLDAAEGKIEELAKRVDAARPDG